MCSRLVGLSLYRDGTAVDDGLVRLDCQQEKGQSLFGVVEVLQLEDAHVEVGFDVGGVDEQGLFVEVMHSEEGLFILSLGETFSAEDL